MTRSQPGRSRDGRHGIRSALTLVAAVAAIAAALLYAPAPVEADEHTAVRSLGVGLVAPGAEVTVTVTARDYGPFARVSETFPDGWEYTGSSLPEAAVSVQDRIVRFLLIRALLGDSPFTYTVRAPDAEGAYAFSGIIEDSDRVAAAVAGPGEIVVHDECLRGPVVADGFSLALFAGGNLDDLAACAAGRAIAALYTLHQGDWLSYLPGAPEFASRRFRELFSEGLPAGAPLVVKGGQDAADSGALRLASLALEGVSFGAFSPGRTEYLGVAGDGVGQTTVHAEAAHSGAAVVILPADADGDPANGHQAALQGGRPVTVAVLSPDGAHTRVYRVWVGGVTAVGGAPSSPAPAGDPTAGEVDFEWNAERDLEALDSGNDGATGLWSDGFTLWIADDAQGAGDAVYAYDLEGSERLREREFALAGTNRAPRGLWADGAAIWVSDSGRDLLFAYDLASGERLPEREIELTPRNSEARGIWARDGIVWVLDGHRDALFAYELQNGTPLAEYALHSANSDPHGIWSDGVTVWVSDHGAKRLFAYRLPVPGDRAADARPEALELERAPGEDFVEPGRVGNNSPRGLWSDGDVIYVADEHDDRVYSYNMPGAIDARLSSLTLSDVEIGEFSPIRTAYEGVRERHVLVTTVGATATRRAATIVIEPPDADGDAGNGHQVALDGGGDVTVTVAVTSPDGSRTNAYHVRLAEPPAPACPAGDGSGGFSLVVYPGGGLEGLSAWARGLCAATLYALADGAYVSYIVDAPDFVNRRFRRLFPYGLAPDTPLVVVRDSDNPGRRQ